MTTHEFNAATTRHELRARWVPDPQDPRRLICVWQRVNNAPRPGR